MELIVALDYESKDQALQTVDKLGDSVHWYKVGKELFTASGPKIVEELKNRNKKVFLDLKFFDIPNTVHKALIQCKNLGADITDIHLLGGREMIDASVDALQGSQTKLFGVSLLTSFSEESFSQLGWKISFEDQIKTLVRFASSCGVDGTISSVHEVSLIKKIDSKLQTLTPGIRLASDAIQDQKRVATPLSAKEAGVDFIVMGRSITQASDPENIIRSLYEAP